MGVYSRGLLAFIVLAALCSLSHGVKLPTNRARKVGRLLRDHAAPTAPNSIEDDAIDLAPESEPESGGLDSAFDRAARGEGDIHVHSTTVKNNPDSAWATHIFPTAEGIAPSESTFHDIVSYLGSLDGEAVPVTVDQQSDDAQAPGEQLRLRAKASPLRNTRSDSAATERFSEVRAHASAQVTAESRAQAQALAAAVADLRSLGIDTSLAAGFVIPQRDPTRVYPVAPCVHCQRLVRGWAQAVIAEKLSRYDSVVRFQELCQREELDKFLLLACEAYNDVEAWLVKGGAVVMNETDFTKSQLARSEYARNSPSAFCISQQLCGPNASDINPLASQDAQRTGAVLVRVRLQPNFNLNSLQGTPEFSKFVRGFLHDLANALDCSPQRLQLHLHKREPKPYHKPAPAAPNITALLVNLTTVLPNLMPTVLPNGSFVFNLTQLAAVSTSPVPSVNVDLPPLTAGTDKVSQNTLARFMQLFRVDNSSSPASSNSSHTSASNSSTPAASTPPAAPVDPVAAWVDRVNASVNGTLPYLTAKTSRLVKHLLEHLRHMSNSSANASVVISPDELVAHSPVLVINPPKKRPPPPPSVPMGQLIELVFKRFSFDDTNPRLTPHQRGELIKGDKMSPDELANALSNLMDQNPSPLQLAPRFTALIDLHFRPQIIPLTISAPTVLEGARKQ